MNRASFFLKSRMSGSVLLPTLFLLAIIAACVGAAFNLSGFLGRLTDRNLVRQKALATADAALELEFAQWCAILQGSASLAPASAAFSNIALPSSSLFPWIESGKFSATRNADTSYVISNYKIQATDQLDNPLANTVSPTQIPTNNVGTYSYHYQATVDVTLQSLSGPVTVRMGRIFQLQNRSPWSYAIFSNGDLEIHPGADMAITGDVHTNGNMYLGAGGSPITFSGNVEASGTIAKGKSPLDPSSRNNTSTTITYLIDGNPRTGVEAQTPLGISQSALSTTDSNQNNDSYREVIETAVDVTNNPDPFSPSDKQTLRYYNMADYKIVISSSDSKLTSAAAVTVLDSNNSVLSTTSDEYKALVTGYTSGNTVYQPILNTTGTMQDSREAVTMKLTTVNVGNIKTAVSKNYLKPTVAGAGILLYIYDNRPDQAAVADIPAVYDKKGKLVTAAVPGTPALNPAIFLDNGSSLPSNGLTVVSGNPIYIQGDYNTGVSTPTSLPSNNPSLASGTAVAANTANNYWEPAAVIGDAITILSNTWTTSSTGATAASPTTVNAAFMSGNLPSNGVSYSGGIENFPRFLENWSNVRFTYYGSMVWLYQCQQATEPWGKSNVYSAPKRMWSFDSHFYSKPPPGTFVVSAYQKLRWFQR